MGLRLQHGLDRWVEACVAIREELNWAVLQNREVGTLAPEPGSVQGLDLWAQEWHLEHRFKSRLHTLQGPTGRERCRRWRGEWPVLTCRMRVK